MKCPRCGADVERDWKYCPECGQNLRGGFRAGPFDDIFSRLREEMREMNQMFDRDLEAFDISPFFDRSPGKGFSVKISRSGNREPEVHVETYGDVDEEEIKERVRRQLGIGEVKAQKKEKPKLKVGKPRKFRPEMGQRKKEKKPERKPPKVTKEPETEVRRLGDRVVVDMEVPGVDKEEDVEINELKSSVEVKAMTGDKAYFKILTKPEDSRIIEKKLEKGKLHLEFS